MKRKEFLADCRKKNLTELDQLQKKHEKELLSLRKESVRGRIKSSAKILQLRREVARIKTIMIEKVNQDDQPSNLSVTKADGVKNEQKTAEE